MGVRTVVRGRCSSRMWRLAVSAAPVVGFLSALASRGIWITTIVIDPAISVLRTPRAIGQRLGAGRLSRRSRAVAGRLAVPTLSTVTGRGSGERGADFDLAGVVHPSEGSAGVWLRCAPRDGGVFGGGSHRGAPPFRPSSVNHAARLYEAQHSRSQNRAVDLRSGAIARPHPAHGLSQGSAACVGSSRSGSLPMASRAR